MENVLRENGPDAAAGDTPKAATDSSLKLVSNANNQSFVPWNLEKREVGWFVLFFDGFASTCCLHFLLSGDPN